MEQHGLGRAIISPADVVYGPRTMVEPDVFVVPLVAGAAPRAWEEVGRLLLTAEVLSPSTMHADRDTKRRLYQRKAVPEYWIVDVDARAFERWRPGEQVPAVVMDTAEWDRIASKR